MPAYYIALRHAMKDEDQMRIYREKTPATLEGREFRVLAQYGRVRITSGEDPGIVAIMEFPSFEAAEEWYESPGYQDAVCHLYAAADMQCFILEGGAEDPA
jgi:uncharacterized protein (DUF1330 family)